MSESIQEYIVLHFISNIELYGLVFVSKKLLEINIVFDRLINPNKYGFADPPLELVFNYDSIYRIIRYDI